MSFQISFTNTTRTIRTVFKTIGREVREREREREERERERETRDEREKREERGRESHAGE